MKLALITKITEQTSNNHSLKYTTEVVCQHPFNQVIILDDLYHGVAYKYDQGSSELEIDLTNFPTFLKDHFKSTVEQKGIYVMLFDNSTTKYHNIISSLLEEIIPSKATSILPWLKKIKILTENEKISVPQSSLSSIRQNLQENENTELKGVFLIEEDFGFNFDQRTPYSISIHAKRNINFDGIRDGDFYIKVHSETIESSFILIDNGEPFTMKEFKHSYELPFPTESLFEKFNFNIEEKEKYTKFYELFNTFNMNHFDIEEVEQSSIGGYHENDENHLDLEAFQEGKEWTQFLKFSSYSHDCDYFNDIGDCVVSILFENRSELTNNKLNSKILLTYT